MAAFNFKEYIEFLFPFLNIINDFYVMKLISCHSFRYNNNNEHHCDFKRNET